MRPDKEMVGQRIKDLRINNGLTLEDFGKLFKTNKVTVYNWERGRNLPNKANIKKLADLAGISVSELLYGEPKNYLNSLLWNSNSLDDFSSLTFEKFFDNLKESIINKDELYLTEEEAVRQYKRFTEQNSLDEYINPLGSSIFLALENKDDTSLVQIHLNEATNNFALLFGKTPKDAHNDLENNK